MSRLLLAPRPGREMAEALARSAHVLLQYGCTMVPSMRLGFLWQYCKGRLVQQYPDRNSKVQTHIARRKEGIRLSVRVCARSLTSTDVEASWQTR